MKKHSALLQIVLFSVAFVLADRVATSLSLYWTNSWTDIVMHGFGGFVGALLVLFVLAKVGISPQTFSRKVLVFLFTIVSVLAVGSIWELWEIFIGLTNPFTDVGDTVLDLIMDTIGAVIGFVYYEKRLKE